MHDHVPFINDGIFNAFYLESSCKEQVVLYQEVDLGELNYINTHTNIFKKANMVDSPGEHSELELKTWRYHHYIGITEPVLPILQKLGFQDYDSKDQVAKDNALLFPQLLKKGYYLYGTQVANLHLSVIPSIDHADFDFFFKAKLYYVSRKLSLIDYFLDFQLKKFIDAGKSVVDFQRFLKLNLREHKLNFELNKESEETVKEWLNALDTKNFKKQRQKHKNGEQWTKVIAITVKSMLNVKRDSYLISKQGPACEAFEILTGYKANSIENLVSRLDPKSTQMENFTSKDFNQAKNFLKNTIHQIDVLKNSTNQNI